MAAKYIFVTGGVVSGLGKGITAASLGRLLKARGFKVAAQKLDPYINIDPGTMSPYQHGEVYVTEDGAETDLDLGHYERFIDEDLNQFSNLTTGKVYWNVLNKERRGEYLGETVQVIPHITNEIKAFIYAVGQKSEADIILTEIGGTTGDIESQPFLEAIRQVGHEAGRDNCLFIHVTLVPYLESSKEHKSKPTQHSVKELQSFGITPDIIVARCNQPIDSAVLGKIALFCNVKPDCVIQNLTLPVLYEAPLMLEKAGLADIVMRELALTPKTTCDLNGWQQMVDGIKACHDTVRIALVGKYVQLHDSYLSVAESLRHGGWHNGVRVEIDWVDSETLIPENAAGRLAGVHGILIPGGFGPRGIEGMIAAAQYAAAAMECQGGGQKPCGTCPACRKVFSGIHPDVITVRDEAHKNLSVDTVRQIRADAYIRPNEGARKVYIFPDCTILTEQDQNVLLKIVEEGPPYATFLFCAENSSVVLQTLRSRCVELKLHPAVTVEKESSEAGVELCRLLAAGKRGTVTELMVRLEKKRLDRDGLAAMLDQARTLLAAALLAQYGQSPEGPDAALIVQLGKRLTKQRIMGTIELLQTYRGACSYNVGASHVLGALAVELEEIL